MILLPKRDGSGRVLTFSLRKGSKSDRRGNPSCLGEWAGGFVPSFSGSQSIATGLRPRDDNTLCHCEEGAKVTDAAIHRVSGEVFDLSLRFLVHSGSPRAFSPRDDKTRVRKRSEVSYPTPFQSSLFTLHS